MPASVLCTHAIVNDVIVKPWVDTHGLCWLATIVAPTTRYHQRAD